METIVYFVALFFPIALGALLAVVVIVLLDMFFGFGDELFK